MSVVTNNILKLLSDLSAASDNIVEENASELNRVAEWGAIVKNKADSIVERESGNPSSESGEIPSLTSFLKGTSRRGPRVSTVLTEIQKSHLHGKVKASIKTRKSRRSSRKTSLRRKSNVKDTNDSIIIIDSEDTPKIIHKAGFLLNQNASSSTSSVETKQVTPRSLFKKTPVNRKGTKKIDRSSKRKSSSELSLEIVKKPKINIYELSDPKERDKSMQKTKVEKLTKSNSSLLPVGSVLKENRTLRSKMETKQEKAVENRKNILALRQQKLEQNKRYMLRTREEKLEKTLEKRLKLEKEKLGKLRSGGGRENPLKTVPNKEETPKANVEKKETLGRTSNPGKNKGKQSLKKMMRENLKKVGTSILKSSEKTPVMKNPNHETEKIMNTTYVAQGHRPSTSGKKVNTLKYPNIGTNSGNTKDVPNDKTQTLAHIKGSKTVPKTMKPLNEEKKKLISTPKAKGPESYAITPTRSSFVSYDISEIRSDSEDEEQPANTKPIPSWATGVRLRNTLLQQHHQPIDTDELFGNFFDPPDLAAIMGVKKKHYNKRTSSAVWNSSFI